MDHYKRILVCNSAHIGDVILTTSVLPVLKSAYPDAEIGMCIGSWSLPVIENHSLVDHVHLFDHPCRNRATKSMTAKKRQGARSWLRAHTQLVEKKYDVAFDFYSFYENNFAKLLYHAHIPERVGWFSSGHIYYTHRYFWLDSIDGRDLHIVEIHGQLLREFGIDPGHLEKLKPTLHYRNEIQRLQTPADYFVIHVGTGEKRKEWSPKAWKALASLLEPLGIPLLFVGYGRRENELIGQITKDLKSPIVLGETLQWRQLISLIKGAKFFVGLDSMAGHIAAAVQTPAALIYGGFAKVARWRPYDPCCDVVMPPQECYDEKGNAGLEAIHKISPEQVFEKIKLALSCSNAS